jgi:tetratricopeptide (TPR) repeat protein
MRTFGVASLLCLLTVTPAAAAWTQIQTPHYLFIGDASAGDMRQIALRFEEFHAVMELVLSRNAVAFATPTVVLVFRNRSSFRPYMPLYEGRPREIDGIALTGGGMNYMAMNAEGDEEAYPVIFHELTHQITHNITPRAAVWLAEGVAEYYSSFEIYDGKDVRLGIPIAHHIRLLREGRFIPLKELLRVTTDSELYNERNRSSLFYAQSWALVHFLVKDPPSIKRFAQYQRATEQGMSQDQALFEAYALDLEALESALRRYVSGIAFAAMHWKFTDSITEADMNVTALDDSAALAHLAALLARMDRGAEAEQRAGAALAVTPRSAMAHGVLAALKVREKRSDEAGQWLEKDSAADSFLDHYTLAIALAGYIDLVGATTPAGARAAAALGERAAAAIAKHDNVAEAWRLAAHAHLLGGNLEQARAAIDRALALARERALSFCAGRRPDPTARLQSGTVGSWRPDGLRQNARNEDRRPRGDGRRGEIRTGCNERAFCERACCDRACQRPDRRLRRARKNAD